MAVRYESKLIQEDDAHSTRALGREAHLLDVNA
jgi:hypothetical protein